MPEFAAEVHALFEGERGGVAEPVGDWEDEAQTLAHIEALEVTLLVAERELHGDGVAHSEGVPVTLPNGDDVAECEAVGRSEAEALPLAVREAMLALALEDDVYETLALVNDEKEALPVKAAEPHEEGVAVCEAVRHSVAEPLPEAHCVAVTLALLHGVDVGQSLALTEGVQEMLLVKVWDPHEDGVADWEADVHSVAEPLPVPQFEAVILAVALGVVVGQSLALTEGENEALLVTVRDPHDDGVADSEAVVHNVVEPLLDAQCVGVISKLPLTVEVRQAVALTEGEKEALIVAVREPQDDGVTECEEVAHSVAEQLLDEQCVGVTLK